MAAWKVITEDAKKLLRIGQVWGRTQHKITDLWVREYAATLRDTNPLWFDDDYAAREGRFGRRAVPSAFVTLFNPMERHEIMPQMEYFGRLCGAPEGGGRWGFAGFNRIEYYDEPIYVGDTVTCETRVADTYEKYSKDTVLVFVEIDYTLTNQDGEKVAKATAGIIHTFAMPN
jgi:acyl dehydratase